VHQPLQLLKKGTIYQVSVWAG